MQAAPRLRSARRPPLLAHRLRGSPAISEAAGQLLMGSARPHVSAPPGWQFRLEADRVVRISSGGRERYFWLITVCWPRPAVAGDGRARMSLSPRSRPRMLRRRLSAFSTSSDPGRRAADDDGGAAGWAAARGRAATSAKSSGGLQSNVGLRFAGRSHLVVRQPAKPAGVPVCRAQMERLGRLLPRSAACGADLRSWLAPVPTPRRRGSRREDELPVFRFVGRRGGGGGARRGGRGGVLRRPTTSSFGVLRGNGRPRGRFGQAGEGAARASFGDGELLAILGLAAGAGGDGRRLRIGGTCIGGTI